ncbi:MAG: hypothetical protein LBL24_09485 [Bacteroidales bacterium]|jgi:hypothetical protein|nr:hypothetical protein [Bacteroidales bacterium]
MKAEDDFVGSSLRQRLANARGRISTQFMSGDLQKENPSGKKALEEGVRMGGYDVNVRKPVISGTDMQQPMAGYSEFWIG